MPENLSLDAIKKLVCPIRQSSCATYNSHYDNFVSFIKSRNGVNSPFALSEVVEYFNFLVNKGFRSSTLKSARSVLRDPLLAFFPDYDILQDALISKLISFVRSNNPKVSFRFPAWDLDLVVRMIQLRDCVDLDYVFKKTLFIVFIACPYRISEFKAISISSSSFSSHHALLKPHILFCSKNQTDDFCPLPIVLQEFSEDSRICPVTLINSYLALTSAMCRDRKVIRPDQLWLGVNLKPLSVNVLSNWIKEVIFLADPNAGLSNFNVHSIRSQVASHLMANNVSVKEIIAAMNWRSSSTFALFYARLGIRTAVRAVLAGHLPAEEGQ